MRSDSEASVWLSRQLAPLDAGAIRLEQGLGARDLGLASGQLAAEVVEPCCLGFPVCERLLVGFLAA